MTDPDEDRLSDVPDPRDAVDAAAQDWFLRLGPDGGDAAAQAEFRAWLAADPRHKPAYDEVRAAWDAAGDLDSTFALDDEVATVTPMRRRRPIRQTAVGGLLAACLALFAAGAALDLPTALRADHATAAGEQRRVALPDGSTAFLNTDTAIAVDYSAAGRRITLLKGEALFEVAKDTARPFDVLALGGRARALGTVYAVRDGGDAAEVTVAEGTVKVSAPLAVDGESAVTLRAGDRVSYRPGGAPGAVGHVEDGAPQLAWRRGVVVLDGAPFARALAEIDRYRPGKILLLADTAKLEPVTAHLSLTALDGGIRALAATHGLHVTQVTDYLLIVR
ncbi:MAG: FecR domain-containing protein [Rhodospirillales bacterium]